MIVELIRAHHFCWYSILVRRHGGAATIKVFIDPLPGLHALELKIRRLSANQSSLTGKLK